MAIMQGLEHWDHLLRGPKEHKTIVITDHTNLQYYRHPHKIGSHISGYITKQEEYPITLMYKPSITNHADGLSRWPDFTPDTHNNDPIIALPADLFSQTNTPILHLETLSKSAQNIPTRCQTLALTWPMSDNTSMDPLEADVLATQLHNTETLQW
jgi:RNase H-like domain found in reverse transcriptase